MSSTIYVIISNAVQNSKQRLGHPLAIMLPAGPAGGGGNSTTLTSARRCWDTD